MDDEHDFEADDPRPLRELLRIAGGRCRDCDTTYTAKEAVWNVALGFKDAPRCLGCLGRGLGRQAVELRTSLTEYVHRRECYLRAWREAERMDSATSPQHPTPPPPVEQISTLRPAQVEVESGGGIVDWDAGGLGCGDLVMQLRMRLKAMSAGSVIRVNATDLAAPEDIPAWCRLTGHTLLTAAPPEYTIRRKEG